MACLLTMMHLLRYFGDSVLLKVIKEDTKLGNQPELKQKQFKDCFFAVHENKMSEKYGGLGYGALFMCRFHMSLNQLYLFERKA